MANATRYNEGKIDFTLIPIDALEGEARVWMAGEKKYGRDNWQQLWGDKTVEIVMQSLLRHAFAILKGEFIDSESGEHHACHIRANAAMLIRHYNESKPNQYTITLPEGYTVDDRYTTKSYEYSTTIQTGTGEDSGTESRGGDSKAEHSPWWTYWRSSW